MTTQSAAGPHPPSAGAFRSEIDACLNRVSAGAWLTQAWLTAARHNFRRRIFVNLFPLLVESHDFKIRLNIFASRELTKTRYSPLFPER
jgi:hypothetical protein